MCTVYKGVAEYSVTIDGVELKEPIEREPNVFGIEHPYIEKVILEARKDKLVLKFHTINAETAEEAYNITKEYAENIFGKIAYVLNLSVGPTSFDGAPISEEVHKKDGTKSVRMMVGAVSATFGVSAVLTVMLGPDKIGKLLNEFQNERPKRGYYCNCYRFALAITDPVARFIMLYGIMLILIRCKQADVDGFIRSIDTSVTERESRAPWKKCVMETIYTSLRNEIGHPPKDKKPEETFSEIGVVVDSLAALVRKAIQDKT